MQHASGWFPRESARDFVLFAVVFYEFTEGPVCPLHCVAQQMTPWRLCQLRPRCPIWVLRDTLHTLVQLCTSLYIEVHPPLKWSAKISIVNGWIGIQATLKARPLEASAQEQTTLQMESHWTRQLATVQPLLLPDGIHHSVLILRYLYLFRTDVWKSQY